MLEYPRWKYLLVVVVLLLALIVALPNVFGDAPALQIARKDHDSIVAAALPTVEQFFKDEHLGYTTAYLDSGRIMVRFANTADQFKARDAVNTKLADQYITALSFDSRAPAFLRALGLRPMKLGLDLRGRSVSAVPGGHSQCDFPAAGQLCAGSAARALGGQSALHRCGACWPRPVLSSTACA